MLRTRVRVASARVTLILAALAGMLVLTVGNAPVAGATTSESSANLSGIYIPVGRWAGTVTTSTGLVESVETRFRLNGKVEVATPTGSFTGTWRQTGLRTFTYQFVRTLSGPGGVVIGSIDIRHAATLTAWNQYTSTGTATAYDLNGNQLFAGTVTSTGTRVFDGL